MSESLYTDVLSTTLAPASVYVLSAKLAFIPAPDSTKT